VDRLSGGCANPVDALRAAVLFEGRARGYFVTVNCSGFVGPAAGSSSAMA
jgi:hypothetical protein